MKNRNPVSYTHLDVYKRQNIPFTEIESIPLLIKDFLEKRIIGFENNVFNEENIEKQFQLKRNSFSQEERKILTKVLVQQYSCLLYTSRCV